MSVFSWMKKNRTIHRAALIAYAGILLLSSVHTHSALLVNSKYPSETAWNASASGATDCGETTPEHHCALCDAIRLASTGLPILSTEIFVWFDNRQSAWEQPDVILTGYHIHTLSRAPPSIDAVLF